MPTPVLKTLFNFNGPAGASPSASLLIDSSGNLFGTAHSGGSNKLGTVFELPAIGAAYGSALPLIVFSSQSGSHPDAGLIADAAGDLFGTTHNGGAAGGGTVFEVVKTSGIYISTPITTLVSFSGTNGPVGGLITDAAGNLFGTTAGGGTGNGTVFEIQKTPTGYASTATTLVSFSGTNGSTPSAGLFLDVEGNLIGTTAGGGANPNGTVFEILKTATGYANAPTTLVSFNGTNGANPNSDLIADANGNLFGTTTRGGANALNDGTVFEILRTGAGYASAPTILVSFDIDDGAFPAAGLIADVAGNLYGTTEGGGANKLGTVFAVMKGATGYAALPTTLASFNGSLNGSVPAGGLIGTVGGNLFGTTSSGGLNGQGTVFEVTGSGFRSSNVVVAPTATSITISPSRGDLLTNTSVTFTVAISAAVTVSSNAPSLTLNDGGSAAYDAAHSTSTSLVFDYTVRSSDSTTSLAVTAIAAHGATITDALGSAADFTSVFPTTFSGVEVNIPAPTVTSVVALPGTGNQQTGTLITLTVAMTEPVTISGGVPSLSLNDGGSAVYDPAHSSGSELAFDYTAQATDSTTALAITGFNANAATIQDALANNADFSAASVTFAALAINSILPSVTSIVASPGAGNVTTGSLVTLTAAMTTAVTVSGGVPTLSLNDGGSATYDPVRSSGQALVFDYTVLSGQTTTALAATAFNANGAKVADALGNAAVLTGAVATFTGLGVNIPAATVLSVGASPGTGNVTSGNLVTLTVTMSKAVTVSAGTPALSLNDSGSATYDPGKSGGTTLVFDYFAQPGQTTTALAVTGLNTNGSMIQDSTGITADFSGATQKFTGLEINVVTITAPTITGTLTGQTTADTAAISPFSNVTITDQNVAQTETLIVTLSSPANGTLTNLGGGTYNATTGVYTDTGSAAAVTTALEGVVFMPTAQQAQAGQTVTTTMSINVADTAGLSAANDATSVVTTGTAAPTTGVLGVLDIGQQLELIYIAYFNRAADSGGYTFWGGQSDKAQTSGQSASVALTNIANSFQPQPETIVLYPFLGGARLNLADPVVQTGLKTFISSVYGNLFGHTADPLGSAYWVGQITSGAVGLGAAALAIANGAAGADGIEVRNKITVAQDFTTRTTAAGLGVSNLPPSFVIAARAVLNGVDGTSLNDTSVNAGMNVTTGYLASSASSRTASLAASAAPASSATATVDPNVIAITGSGWVVDPGAGNFTIQFLAGASADTLVLHAFGVDQVSGFDPGTDVLDVRSLLREANVDPHGDFAALSNYLTVRDQGADALLRFDPFGQGGGSTVAVLQGLGHSITSLDMMTTAIRIA
jgi:uncharacterized repeat protein (TIGR03803 family)